MVSDQEPRYRLVDSNGNVVGTLFAESDGTLKLQEGTSGDENEVTLGTNGTVKIDEVQSPAETNDSTERVLSVPHADNESVRGERVTTSVTTTATKIYDASGFQTLTLGHFSTVVGEKDGSSGKTFTDLVVWTFDGDATVVASATNQIPASRSYSVPSTNELHLSMGSDTYFVACQDLGLRF